MYAKKRLCFSLLGLLLFCSLGAHCDASAAEKSDKMPYATPLPADRALSVSISIRATWESMMHSPGRKRTCEIPAEVSAYALTDTPTRENLADHQLPLPALPTDPEWYAFQPTTDRVSLTVHIVDTDRRLGRIVLSDLRTGHVLGAIDASADGYSLRGQFKILWEQPFYRIEGYDIRNIPLFRLGVSHGQPDTFVHFTVQGEFAPFHPAAVSSARFPETDPGKGTVGNPYEWRGVTISTHPGDGYSVGYAARDKKNDVQVTNPLQPPSDYLGYFKKFCLERVTPQGYFYNDRLDRPKAYDDARTLEQEDTSRGLSDLDQPPYSDCTGHWEARFVGKATAFLIVPYTVARRQEVLFGLKSLFGTLANKMPDSHISSLAFGLEEAFAIWLQSDAGRQSGYTAGMAKALGDVKTVETQTARKEFVVAQPLFENVTVTLLPDIAPLSGKGVITIKNAGFNTSVSPPPALVGSTLTVPFPAFTGTLKLPKGYKWEITAKLSSLDLYEIPYAPVEVRTPAMDAVKVTMLLTALRQLTIYTVNTEMPYPPVVSSVQVLNAANQVVASGKSALQADGKCAFSAMYLLPGIYTVKTSPTSGKPKWEVTGVITVFRGRLMELTVGAFGTPPPHR